MRVRRVFSGGPIAGPLFLFLAIAAAASAGGIREPPLRVAAVQFAISGSTYASEDAFRAAVSSAMDRAAAFHPDLVVFPEYTGVFAALIPHAREVAAANGFLDAFRRAQAVVPEARTMRDLFLLHADATRRLVLDVFGGLARARGVTVVAGTYFDAADSPTAPPGARGRTSELRNRALVLGPDGKLLYSQDKVFLTDFEVDNLGLSEATAAAADGFTLAGRRIVLTICKDTFEREWEDRFRGADFWIDIKANGVPFTEEERVRFGRALPARLPGAQVPWGLTACLTGRFLDLMWEGTSSFVRMQDGAVRTVSAAQSGREGEILFAEVGR